MAEQVVDLDRCERGAFQGKKKDTVAFSFLLLFLVQFSISIIYRTQCYTWYPAPYPRRSLLPGRSAIPLNFTHAELIKFLSGFKLHLRS
jgi:hypothetical protein